MGIWRVAAAGWLSMGVMLIGCQEGTSEETAAPRDTVSKTAPQLTQVATPEEKAQSRKALEKLAGLVDQMREGEWKEIPGTEFDRIRVSEEEANALGVRGNTGSRSVIIAWNGAAYDPAEHHWYFHGGGHTDYAGNEVYRFDLTTLKWERLTDPAPLTEDSGTPKCPIPARSPSASHTYDGIIWSPPTQTIFVWVGLGYCCCDYLYLHELWEFDPSSKTWTQHDQTEGASLTGNTTELKTAYDPVSQKIIVQGSKTDAVGVFDPQLHVYTDIASTGISATDGTAVFVPELRQLFVLSRVAVLDAIDINEDGTIGSASRVAEEKPDGSPLPTFGSGLAYHSPSQRIVFWVENNPRQIQTYNPITGEWQVFDNSASPHAPSDAESVYSKFIWIEALDVFAGYSNPDEGIWLYKLPAEPPPPDANRYFEVCTKSKKGACVRYSSLKQAFAAVIDEGIINIGPAPQPYFDCGTLEANGVTINAAGAHIANTACAGKAALVIQGDDTVIEGLECSGIAVTDGNGACIRLEGKGLTLRNVYFHDSQEGILAGDYDYGLSLIEDSVFERLGYGGQAHGVYFGYGENTELVIRRSKFLSSKGEGHEVKSRAAKTIIENSIVASLDGTDSRLIDIPNGGEVIIRDSVLEKGPNSSNQDAIGIGLEGVEYEANSTLIENNMIILERNESNVLVHARGVPDPLLKNNIIVGGTDPGGTNTWYPSRSAAGLEAYPALPSSPAAH